MHQDEGGIIAHINKKNIMLSNSLGEGVDTDLSYEWSVMAKYLDTVLLKSSCFRELIICIIELQGSHQWNSRSSPKNFLAVATMTADTNKLKTCWKMTTNLLNKTVKLFGKHGHSVE